MNIIWDSGRAIRGIDSTTDFSVAVTPVYTQHGGTSGPVTDKDVSAIQTTGSTTDVGFSLSVTNPLGNGCIITNNSTSTASLSGAVFSPIVSGSVNYDVSVIGNTSRRYSQSVTHAGSPATTYELTGYTAGSLARHVHDSIVALLAAHTPSQGDRTTYTRFNGDYTGSVDSPTGSRNTSAWSYLLDLSGVSFSRNVLSGGTKQDRWGLPVTLIHTGSDTTTRFGLVANHTPILAGYKVNFLKQDGSFAQATVQSVTNVGGDLDLVYFTANVVGPRPLKTLGSGWELKLPCSGGGLSNVNGVCNLPALFVGGRLYDASGYSHVRIGKVGALNAANVGISTNYSSSDVYLNPFYGAYTWPVDVGDSSGPTLLPINSELAIVATQFHVTNGPCVPYYRTTIDAMMTSIAGVSTTFSTVNLSGFTTF